jgi:hypothetical protein
VYVGYGIVVTSVGRLGTGGSVYGVDALGVLGGTGPYELL